MERYSSLSERRRSHLIFAGLGVIAVGLVVWVVFHGGPVKAPPNPAVPVTLATAESRDVPISISELGAAQAWTSVAVLAQVSGKLVSVDFNEGTDVKAGQVLARIDPSPYLAALTQAEGALARDRALLADARLDLARYESLKAQNAIAGQTVDTQAALVRQDLGTVLMDEGTVANARVNLAWCNVVSPISGRAGVRLVDPGNLVSASGGIGNTPVTPAATNTSSVGGSVTSSGSSGGSSIVVINQIQPIAVTFTVPEGEFQRLSQLSDGFRKPFAVEASSQETGMPLGSGELAIADNRVDPTTGTIELKARFPNTDEKLWPGEFVNVALTLEVLHGATTIPTAAVNEGPNGSFVYVVGPDKTVSARPVVLAWTEGATAVIKSGVKAGDSVVTDGQMILKPGSLVRPVRPAAGRLRA